MGVLYANVNGTWVPILGGAGNYLPLSGGTLTGKLALPDSGDVSEVSTTHPLQIGTTAAANMRLDTNEIMAVTNGVRSNLILQGNPLSLYGGPSNFYGDVNIGADQLSFGSVTRQMLQLFSTTYALGVQSSTIYTRTGNQVAWFMGGSHSDTASDPGSGGKLLMILKGAYGLEIGADLNYSRPLGLYGVASGAASCYIGFYNGAATPVRHGWVGFNAGHMQVTSETASAQLKLVTASNGGDILFMPGATEGGRWSAATNFLYVGKTTYGNMVEGCELQPGGIASFTTSGGAAYPLWLNHIGAADASGVRFATFRRSGNVEIGNIAQSGTTAVVYNTSSDYRLKQEIGPVPEPVNRVKRLRPIHFAWKADDRQQDGFLAHEVAEVVPDAVTGEKDATDDDGQIVPQGLDNGRLVPLLTAALQQALSRIESLEQRVAELEAA